MYEQRLAITTARGQTIFAVPGPEHQREFVELLGDRPAVELTAPTQDVEGHALSANDVLVDVEGHALTLHVPNAADAAALRRALAVGVVSATLVGAGAIAALQTPSAAPANVQPGPAQVLTLTVPAQAIHADEAAAQRELRFEQSAASTQTVVTRVPVQAIHADEASTARTNQTRITTPPAQAVHADQAAVSRTSGQTEAAPVPAQALHADQAETAKGQ